MATVVLVTGGSGFIASHLILQLLAAGDVVRATPDVRKSLAAGAVVDDAMLDERLAFVATDLTADAG